MKNVLITLIVYSQLLYGTVPAHIADLRNLISNINPVHNEYMSGNQHIEWGEKDYRARVVCSGLFKEILVHSFGLSEGKIKKIFKEKWPETDDIAAAVRHNNKIFQIITFDEIEIGDVVLIDYNSDGKIPTGHIMFVNEKPRQVKAGENGETESIVGIIDSTRSPHGRNDTRAKKPASTGVGIGEIVLFTADNSITGYKWSTNKSSRRIDVSNHEILLFRISVPQIFPALSN